MTNKEIINSLKITQKLLELHNENPFKIKGYGSAIFNIENYRGPISDLSVDELNDIGIKKGMADKIQQLNEKGTFEDLENLLKNTPEGVLKMLNIKGIGPKKIRLIWKELGIENKSDLLEASRQNKVAALKGFGDKTQQSIIEYLEFEKANEGNFRYADIIQLVKKLEHDLTQLFKKAMVTGQVRRAMPVIDLVELIVTYDSEPDQQPLKKLNYLTQNHSTSGPFTWRGTFIDSPLNVEILFVKTPDFTNKLIETTGSELHTGTLLNTGKTLYQELQNSSFKSESDFYNQFGYYDIPPETREGFIESAFKKDNASAPTLTNYNDIKGILHNHCTYSDGKHSLREMAEYCKELGFEYLGITDHSVSAFYANGLDEHKVFQQHQEIDQLNEELAPFKLFKGIESDILNDGSLDYPNEILSSFDFIVSSIHSNLNMDIEKATSRLIKAIENPYTTILGHPTGRLLTSREGYPVNHKKVIDACADNGVIIEINANPWRLDIDWKWIPYCIEKGVKLSINPDAHEKTGYHDMEFGVLAGRKGGLTKEMTFNTLSLREIESHFLSRKSVNV